MKKIILLLSFAIFIFPSMISACTCGALDTFCETIAFPDGSVVPELIVRGKIVESLSTGEKSFELSQVIYGEINQDRITITPDLCTLFYQELKDGKEYIFALRTYSDSFHPVGCGVSFLLVDNDIVKGQIAPQITSIPYSELPNIESCNGVFDNFSLESNLSLFPSLTNGELNIKNISTELSLIDLQVKVFDVTGRELAVYKSEEEILPETIWEINIDGFATGMYILQLSDKFRRGIFKIIKQ